MPSSAKWTEIAELIARAEETGAVIGVAAISPGGERFSHNGDRRFIAASTVKIAIMIELFRQIDAGRESLNVSHVLRAEDKATGSGIVAHLHDGIAFTLGDLAYLMMSISDNSATNILIDRLDIGNVNATMRDLGMTGSTLGRRMRGSHLREDEQENWAVPNDYATVVAALLENRAASPESCSQMWALMEKQQNDRRIARHLPRANPPRWGSKTGSLPGVVNDVGFVTTSAGPLIVAVFCEGLADAHAGEQLIGDITKAALGESV